MENGPMLDEMIRRLRAKVVNMIAKAVIDTVNDGTKHQTTQVKATSETDLRKANHAQPFGLSFTPPSGAEGILLCPGGDSDQAILICPMVPSERPTGHGPGTGGLYQGGAFRVYLNETGGVLIGSDAATHAMVLGDQLKTSLDALTVPTAMGPSGTPINAASFTNFLSTKHKLDE
jgi:phage baseplate assembly protein V